MEVCEWSTFSHQMTTLICLLMDNNLTVSFINSSANLTYFLELFYICKEEIFLCNKNNKNISFFSFDRHNSCFSFFT